MISDPVTHELVARGEAHDALFDAIELNRCEPLLECGG